MRIENIQPEQLSLFASAICKPTPEQYLTYAERLYCLEPQLDSVLLKPNFLYRLVQPPQSHYASLCGLHKILNAKVVHQVFVLLTAEVGIRLNSLVVAGRDKVGHETWDRSILNLRSLHGAWLTLNIFTDTFGHTLDVPEDGYSNDDYLSKWTSGQDQCEACTLTKVGGDLDTVFDLQMILLSRTRTKSKRKCRKPRLSRVIEGWLKTWEQYYSVNEWQSKLQWNLLRAERLKNVRKAIIQEKRQTKKLSNTVSKRETEHEPTISAPIVKHEPRYGADKEHARLGKFHECLPDERDDHHHQKPNQSESRDLTAETDAEDEDEHGVEKNIRDTLYQTENEIIDCYEALISTPFLPGMSPEEHRRRVSLLSQHCEPLRARPNEMSWPMVKNEEVKQQLARSKSTVHRRSSNYSESQSFETLASPRTAPYIPPRQQWATLGESTSSSNMQERRISINSWVTESVPPSAMNTPREAPKNLDLRRARKSAYGFSPIEEKETTLPYQNHDFEADRPVSPIRDHHATDFRSYGDGNLIDTDSPISPISIVSPLFPQIKSQSHDRPRHEPGQTSRQQDQNDPSRSDQNCNASTIGCNKTTRPSISSRTSKPPNEPVADPNCVLNTVKQLRERSTATTDMTHWSSIYGGESERLRRLENERQDRSVPSRSKSEKVHRRT